MWVFTQADGWQQNEPEPMIQIGLTMLYSISAAFNIRAVNGGGCLVCGTAFVQADGRYEQEQRGDRRYEGRGDPMTGEMREGR